MRIAQMRSKITIQKNTITSDSIGNRQNTWTNYYTCRCYANMSQNLKGAGESESAGQVVATDTFVFTVRYCSTLANISSDGYRVLFKNRPYNITKVDNYQFKNETLKLTAERIQR